MAALRKNVLVIEDDPDIRESLAEILDSEGFGVLCASNGLEGLDRMRAGVRPDLILLDLMMPVKDGFEFRQEQLADTSYNKIPVIIISADARIAERKACIQADEYLKKPVDLDQLIAVVLKYVHR